MKGLGGPSGAQRPKSPAPGCQVLPIRVPRWTLRPCTRLERLRHSCGKTEEEAVRKALGLEGCGRKSLGSPSGGLPQPAH